MIPHNVNLSRIRDDNLRIRLERAQSWMDLAESHENSAHARFIFYWIAFNAMYGQMPPNLNNQEEQLKYQRDQIKEFLERLKRVIRVCGERESGRLYRDVHKMKDSLQFLIEDPFLSKKYWEGRESPLSVKRQCASDWEKINEEMSRNCLDFEQVFLIPCSRLLVLRNQMLHGSAKGNRQSRGFPSLKKGLQVIEKMVPFFFELLTCFEDPSEKWPKAPYPRLGHPEHPRI